MGMVTTNNKKILFTDFEKCTGCRTCEVACSLQNERVCNPALSRISIIEWRDMGIDVPMVCQQCDVPLCQAVCPVEATARNEETGAMVVDDDLCIGCLSCVAACPFGAVAVHPRTGKLLRCTLCDGDPTCVKFCETQALQFEDPAKHSYLKKKASASKLAKLLARIDLE
jgi:Fe-S-cluster-containing dehydrogenase component